jgi:hypothetical protein
MLKIVLFSVLLSLSIFCWGKEEEEKEEPPPVGNFSVPVITQISPLISFGQLLVGENAFLSEISGFNDQTHHGYSNVIEPNAIYGIRNDMSLFVMVPLSLKSKEGSSHSSGIGDVLLQYEYGFYQRTKKEYTLVSTVVANVQFPTGSSRKKPPTETGWFSYFLGTTFAYTSFNWYAFFSTGGNFPTAHHGTKFGNEYLYQCGFARYIEQLSPPGCIFDLMIEFDGTYSQKDRFAHARDRNSGGNAIFVTPSIWLSSKSWLLQSGASFPILQNLNGEQDKIKYSINYAFGVAFQF